MSLESLFQHIIFSEHQAEESRRVMREGGPALAGRLALGVCTTGWSGREGLVEFATWRETSHANSR